MDATERRERRKRIISVISRELDVDEKWVVATASFISDLGAEEILMLALVIGLEEEFGLEISDEETEKFRTVQDVFDFISSTQEG